MRHFTKYLCVFLIYYLAANPPAYPLENENIECVKQLYPEWGRYCYDTAFRDNLIYAICGDQVQELNIMNLEDPTNPVGVSNTQLPQPRLDPRRIALSNTHILISRADGVLLYELDGPLQPVYQGIYAEVGGVYGLAAVGDYAYLGTSRNTLAVLNISDLQSPELISEIDIGDISRQISILGNHLYNAGYKFTSIDISDPGTPLILDSLGYVTTDIELMEDVAFILGSSSGVISVDISDPSNLSEMSNFETRAYRQLALFEDKLFVSYAPIPVHMGSGYYEDIAFIQELDVSDPTNINLRAQHQIEECIYVLNMECFEDALLVLAYDYYFYDPNSFLKISTFHKDYAFSGLDLQGTELWLGVERGLTVHDITNPSDPKLTRKIALNVDPHEIAIFGDNVFVGDREAHLRGLYTSPSGLHMVDVGGEDPPKVFEIDIIGEFECMTKDNSGYLYLATTQSDRDRLSVYAVDGLHLLSRIVIGDGVKSLSYDRSTIYACMGDDGMLIYDVSDRSHPELIAKYETDGIAYDIEILGDNALLADGDLKMLDLSIPSEPKVISTLEMPGAWYKINVNGNIAIITGIVQDDRTFYQYGGIWLVDISDIEQMKILGYYYMNGSPKNTAFISPYLITSESNRFSIYDCSEALGIDDNNESVIPANFEMFSYPNPFNSNAKIDLTILEDGNYSILVYDLSGRLMRVLQEQSFMMAGTYAVPFQSTGLASGTYCIRVESDYTKRSFSATIIR